MRFSSNFGLGKKQNELDFVDIPLDNDIQLFIDPYALSTRNDEFSIECTNIIVNFFQSVIDDIKNSNFTSAKQNLNSLNEPNETHLGMSIGIPVGRGVSGKQSIDVFDRLQTSKAAVTGFLKDLSDCELVIPNISKDKISDIVTNIIKSKLLDYTEQQCITYNIQTTNVNSGRYWNPVSAVWESRYANLPIYKNKRILLVPKAIVRYTLEYNHQKYYNGFVLEYLQEEHLDTNTSLVRLLKNGNRVVYKKDLKSDPRFKLTKEFLYEFSKDHPEVLDKYTTSLPQDLPSLSDKEIEERQQNPDSFDIDNLKNKLGNIPTGNDSAGDYHTAIIGILEVIFYPNLYSPTKEERIHNGRKRIDITYLNAAKKGFFEYLVNNNILCPLILCECKNYSEDPQNPELDQLSGRFSPRRGRFGFLVCRNVSDKKLMSQRCKDTADDDRGYVVVIDDNDILQLLDFRKQGNDKAIDDFLTAKFKELIS